MFARLLTTVLLKGSDLSPSDPSRDKDFLIPRFGRLAPLLPSERSAIEDNLLTKFCICCVIFDFANPSKNVEERQIKSNALQELVGYIPSVAGTFSDTTMLEFINMISLNIFRPFPSSLLDDGIGSSDLSWPHLQLVYDTLLAFVQSKDVDPRVAAKHINHAFLLRLLDLFDTPYAPEREKLRTVLHNIYLKFTGHRSFIRKAVNNIFHQFVLEPISVDGIGELLEVYGSIISGFSVPLKGEHKIFLERALIPLHKPDCVWVYHRQLSFCVVQFVNKDSKLAGIVIKGLLKYWPVTNSQKEVLFLQELEEILEMTEPAEFRRCMVPLFRRIGQSLSSSHLQVATSAILFWRNDHILDLIAQNRQVILPLIIGSLEKSMKNHWSLVVNGFAADLRKQFLELDQDLFESCQKQYQEEEERAKDMEERREKVWKQLEALAISRSPGKLEFNQCLEA